MRYDAYRLHTGVQAHHHLKWSAYGNNALTVHFLHIAVNDSSESSGSVVHMAEAA